MGMLVLTQPGNRANTYGPYTTAVLKAEGFADLDVQPIGEPALARLDAYDAVILTPSLLRRAYVERLVAFVKAGGRLIALRPSRLLALELGLVPTETVSYPAYVRPLPGNSISAGVPHESVQTHMPADNYEPLQLPEGTREIARIYVDAEVETSYSAILHFPLGQGQVVVFGYDLAQAVALIRQGNPVHYGWRTLGFGGPYRPNEFLYQPPGFPPHASGRRPISTPCCSATPSMPLPEIRSRACGTTTHRRPRAWWSWIRTTTTRRWKRSKRS